MERRSLALRVLVAAGAVAVIALVAALVAVSLNRGSPSGSASKPPPLPPLSGPLPPGRGLDWSRVGYREGLEPVPSPPTKYNVLDFGAKGDNFTDDTEALEAAIRAANDEPGVVYLPPGVYRLSRPLQVSSSNVVIRGAGEGSTVLFIPVSLADVFPGSWEANADGSVSTPWTYSGGFLSFVGKQQRSFTTGTRLAKISGEVQQGDTVLPVDKPRKFEMGQWVHVFINDQSTDKNAPPNEGAGEDSVTTFSVRRRLAAADGTIAAWVYGDNLADSGSGSALNKDEVRFSARVAAIGNDWVAIDRPLPFPVRAGWVGDVNAYEPSIQDAGVEQLTLQFAHSMMGPHLTERGYNGIEFAWAANVWVRQVTVLNADNGLRFKRVDRSLISDVTVGVTELRWNASAPDGDEVNGHHAISVTEGHDNLVTRFNVAAPFHHDVTLASGALSNVVSNGTGADLCIDLHRAASFGNLFTRLHVGAGTRPLKSGGREDRGAHAGRQTTFWNLGSPPRGDPPPRPPPPPPSPLLLAPAPAPSAPAMEQSGTGGNSRRLLGGPNSSSSASSTGGSSSSASSTGGSRIGASSGSSGSIEVQQPPWQLPQRAPLRRALQQDGSEGGSAAVELPDCDFGALLNFVGSFSGDSTCAGMEWLVQSLGEDAPADLHASQVAERSARMGRSPSAR